MSEEPVRSINKVPVIKTFNRIVLDGQRADYLAASGRFEWAGTDPTWFLTTAELEVRVGGNRVGTARNFLELPDGSVAATITVISRYADHDFRLGLLYEGGLAVLAFPPKSQAQVA
jgi:hypothetical protein